MEGPPPPWSAPATCLVFYELIADPAAINTTMCFSVFQPTHNFVPTQSQNQQARAQYPSYQYRTAQHGTRPANHPR